MHESVHRVQLPDRLALHPSLVPDSASTQDRISSSHQEASAAAATLTVQAGHTIPETSIAVMNGQGNKVVQAFMAGSKQGLVVTQRLWRLTGGSSQRRRCPQLIC